MKRKITIIALLHTALLLLLFAQASVTSATPCGWYCTKDSLKETLSATIDTTLINTVSKETGSPKATQDTAVKNLESKPTLIPSGEIKTLSKAATPLTDENCALNVTYYKELMAKHQYRETYSPWRSAFTGCGELRLDLYVDGVAILSKMIEEDTTTVKDRVMLQEHSDQLMELFELAVKNLDALNAQIDTKRSLLLTEAALRAQQSLYYSKLYWNYYKFFDELNKGVNTQQNYTSINRMYEILQKVVYSTGEERVSALNFKDYIDNYYLKVNCDLKFTKDSAAIKQKMVSDFEQLRKRLTAIEATVKGADAKNNYTSLLKECDNKYNSYSAYFIDRGDSAKIVDYYTGLYYAAGDKVNEDLLNDILRDLKKYPNAPVYREALRHDYKNNPSYAKAVQIASASMNMKEYTDAIVYFENALDFDEFKKEEAVNRAKIYYYLALCNSNIKRTTVMKRYADLAVQTCPDYPEPYTAQASFYILNKFYSNDAVDRIKYCVAADIYSLAMKKVEQARNNPAMTTKITTDYLNKRIAECSGAFPKASELFGLGSQTFDYNKYVQNHSDFNFAGRVMVRVRTSN